MLAIAKNIYIRCMYKHIHNTFTFTLNVTETFLLNLWPSDMYVQLLTLTDRSSKHMFNMSGMRIINGNMI